jgi:hypothetical protein
VPPNARQLVVRKRVVRAGDFIAGLSPPVAMMP